jgi:quinolinate synthase
MDVIKYSQISTEEAALRIREIKKELGSRLLFLAHNYQRNEVYQLGDSTGDSLELSKKARDSKEAEYIVFAAVHFMAETARILAQNTQRVFLPNKLAGCPMADMGEADKVERAWQEIQRIFPGEVIPITYVNSDAELKAFCGREGGACVTSGNAADVFRWAYRRKKRIMFFPDEHLGRNTGNRIGVAKSEQVIWDPNIPDSRGGIAPGTLERATLILWKGYCHVHTHFTPEHVANVRREKPNAIIIVHPECREEVVRAADMSGSTKFMHEYVEQAPAGAEIVIGTEINHVRNLAYKYPDKKISELSRSLCPNMYKTNLKHVLFTLENLPNTNEVVIAPEIKAQARLALERMFEATP